VTRFWRIRVGNEDVVRSCINDGCIAVGWGEIDDLCNRDDIWLKNEIRDWYTSPQSLGNAIRQIRDFCDSNIDDEIILYNSGSICAVGKVKGPYYHKESLEYRGWGDYISNDIGFYNKKKVDWDIVFDPYLRVRYLDLPRRIINKLNTMPTILEVFADEWIDIQSVIL